MNIKAGDNQITSEPAVRSTLAAYVAEGRAKTRVGPPEPSWILYGTATTMSPIAKIKHDLSPNFHKRPLVTCRPQFVNIGCVFQAPNVAVENGLVGPKPTLCAVKGHCV